MKKGFTLIEILIVITIVGILIAIATSSYLTALKQSRDTRRKTDLEQIRQGLETYRSENGLYPESGNGSWKTNLTSGGFISAIPSDPKPPSSYAYVPGLGDTTYSLCATLEIIPSPVIIGCGDAIYNYEITNP